MTRVITPDCGHVVITGGPSVGKTTLIKALRRKGLPVAVEVGSVVIRHGLYHPAKDRRAFQSAVLQRQLQVERRLPRNRRHFLDRGLLDGVAYYLIDGLAVPDELF